jgi:hypothetical protein
MATRRLDVVIAGDAKPLGIAAKQADAHISKIGSAGARMGKTLALGFAGAGVAAGGALVVGLKKSVDAAKEAEVSQAKLKAQLHASGISYRAHAKDIDAVIQKHSRLAGVDDEDLQDAFTGLVRTTGSVSKSMHDMGLVTDIARGKHIDVTKAAELLGKVHNGNVAVLKRYGIAFDPVTKAQDRLKESNKKATAEQIAAAKATDKTATSQKAMAELQKRFGGQAEAYGKTAAGASDRFHVALENVEEKLGKGLLPILAKVTGGVATFLQGIDSGTGVGGRFATAMSAGFGRVKSTVQAIIPTAEAVFKRLKNTITGTVSTISGLVRGFQQGKGSAVAIVAVVGGLVTALGTAAIIIKTVSAVTKAWAVVQAALNVVMTANPIGLVVVAIAGLAAGLVIAYKRSETFRDIVNGAFGAAKKVVLGAIHAISAVIATFAGALKAYVGIYAAAAKAIGTAVVGGFSFIKSVPGKIGGWLKSGVQKIGDFEKSAADAALNLGKKIVGGIIGGLGSLGHELLQKVKDAIGWVADKAKGIGGSIGNALNPFGDGIGSPGGDGMGMLFPSLGGFSGGLDGANAFMAPFASLGSSMGLHLTAGRNHHSTMTTSGNVSYHSYGDAIDEAGPFPAMHRYAQALYSRFGGRLRELISPWPELGIKDGHPFRYDAATQAQHSGANAHVHVAYAPSGDGIGQTIQAAYAEGLRGEQLVDMVAIAGRESGFNPGATNLKPPDHSIGLWQINQLAHHGEFGTDAQLKNPRTNAHAMAALLRARPSMMDWNHAGGPLGGTNVAQARAAVQRFLSSRGSGGSSGGSSGGGSKSGGGKSGSSGPKTKTFTAVVSNPLTGKPGGTVSALGGGPALLSPSEAAGTYGGGMDAAELQRVRAGDNPAKLLAATNKEIKLKSARLKKLQKTLKGRLTAATRSTFTQEATTLIGELRDLRSFARALGKSVKSGARHVDPSTGEAPPPDAPDAPDLPTAGDFVDAAIAEAALTPDTADDISAASGAVGYWESQLAAARASGDPRRVTAAAGGLKSARDNLAALTDALNANTDALNGVRADLEKQRADQAEASLRVSQSQYGILEQAFVEIFNRRIGAMVGLGLSGLNAPAGAVSRA